MFNSIKTSLENKQIVSELTSKLALGTENVIARIALGYSLAKHDKLDLGKIEDSKGKEYSSKVLFGDNQAIYVALICQKYGIYKENREMSKYLKLHVDLGLKHIYSDMKDNPNKDGVDILLKYLAL